MKRDMDLVRKILLALEAEQHWYAPKRLMIDGHTQGEIGYHVQLMIEAGLLFTTDCPYLGTSGRATSITWKGHDWLASVRDESAWQMAKELIAPFGGASSEIWAAAYAKLAQQ